jgi:hypothetical protein
MGSRWRRNQPPRFFETFTDMSYKGVFGEQDAATESDDWTPNDAVTVAASSVEACCITNCTPVVVRERMISLDRSSGQALRSICWLRGAIEAWEQQVEAKHLRQLAAIRIQVEETCVADSRGEGMGLRWLVTKRHYLPTRPIPPRCMQAHGRGVTARRAFRAFIRSLEADVMVHKKGAVGGRAVTFYVIEVSNEERRWQVVRSRLPQPCAMKLHCTAERMNPLHRSTHSRARSHGCSTLAWCRPTGRAPLL